MRITIENAGKGSLEDAQRLLAGIPGGVEKAVRSAMSRATSHLRTNASREIRKRYAISDSALRTAQTVKISYSYGNGVVASVLFSGSKIPLYRFNGTTPSQPAVDKQRLVNVIINGNWRKVHPGIAASGHQLKDTAPTRFENSFVARMNAGHIGIFERTGGVSSGGADEVREIMGSSVPQMLGNEAVSKSVAENALAKFDERLEHEVSRIINGYGG